MIKLSKINSKEFYLNESLIEVMEETPDTKITLTNGKTYIVTESCSAILELISVASAAIQIRQRQAVSIEDFDGGAVANIKDISTDFETE